MKVNDIVAIKNGGKLIALVQVIGGAMKSMMMKSETDWIVFRRPIRVLIGTFGGNTTSAKKTLVICSSENAETTKNN